MSDRHKLDGGGNVRQNPAFAYLDSLGEGSRRAMRQALARVVLVGQSREMPALGRGEAAQFQNEVIGAFDWHLLTAEQVVMIREALTRDVLVQELHAKTANKMLAALTGVIKQAWRLGYLDAERKERLLDFRPIPMQRADETSMTQQPKRRLAPEELLALADACRLDRTATGVRDMAIIAVAYCGGLSRTEMVGLMLSDYEQDADVLTIRGARSKVRSTPVPLATDELRAWLRIRREEAGPLFTRIIKGRAVHQTGLTAQAITYILAKRGKDAGLRPFSPRDIRNTYMCDLLDAGVDRVTVSEMTGYASVEAISRFGPDSKTKLERAALIIIKPW